MAQQELIAPGREDALVRLLFGEAMERDEPDLPVSKYSEDQPRDDNGRFGEGGGAASGGVGGNVGSTAEAAALAELDASRAEVQAYCRDVAEKLGYDPNNLNFKEYSRPINVGGQQFSEGGNYDPVTGEITINIEGITRKEDLGGLVAHEIQHDRFSTVTAAYRQEFGAITSEQVKADGTLRPEYVDRYPTYSAVQPYFDNLSQLTKDDGVTDYSKAYWKANTDNRIRPFGTISTSGTGVSDWMAINETLAEIANLNYKTGKTNGTRIWKGFYKAVNKEAKRLKGSTA